jgi:Domain of Unknown Function (DUF1206)
MTMAPQTAPIPSPRPGAEALGRRRELQWLARAGLLARGAVYAIVGILALKLAVGSGGATTNQQGALQRVAYEPFGKALLLALAVGLAGYAAWRLLRAAIGHGSQETDGTLDRLAGVASGLAYGALCVTAVKIFAGSATNSGSGAPKSATAGVLGFSAGTVIVAGAGMVLIGTAFYQGYKGLSQSFLKTSKTQEMSRSVRRAFTAIGTLGHLARMVVFSLVGYGLIVAAIDYDPHKAIGLDGALRQLTENAYGPVLLGVVAAGLIAFALYSIVDARYRKI